MWRYHFLPYPTLKAHSNSDHIFTKTDHDLEGPRDSLISLMEEFATEITGFDNELIHGRIYPASSIEYRFDEGLVQRASSPGYA